MPRRYKRKIGRPKKPGPKPRKELGTTHPATLPGTRERLKAEIERTGGHMARTAWLMNVTRTTLYRWLKMWELWPVVNAARRQRFEGTEVNAGNNLIERTRMALRS